MQTEKSPEWWMAIGVLRGQHPSPGVTDDVVVEEGEGSDDVLELSDEQVYRPERSWLFGKVCGPSIADLIVEDYRTASGEILQRIHVIMGEPWTAVQDDDGSGQYRNHRLPIPNTPRLEDLPVVFEGDKAAVRGDHWRSGSGQGEEMGEKCDSDEEETAHVRWGRDCPWESGVGERKN